MLFSQNPALSVQAVVAPGGIWQEKAHGCWTQLQITYAAAASWRITYPSTLLHEVARYAQSQESTEVISMIVAKNPGTLTVRSEPPAPGFCSWCHCLQPATSVLSKLVFVTNTSRVSRSEQPLHVCL